jgi:uncharacterized membrane protein YkoI
MIRVKFVPVAVATSILLGLAVAASAESRNREEHTEIATILAAPTSLGQAIATAEGQAGGRAVTASVEREDGTFFYQIKTIVKSDVTEIQISPSSGKVLKTEADGLIEQLSGWKHRKAFEKASAAPTTLDAAVASAEKRTGGKAIEAAVDTSDDGAVLYTVEVSRDGAMQKVTIDGGSGKILRVAAADDRHDDGERDED